MIRKMIIICIFSIVPMFFVECVEQLVREAGEKALKEVAKNIDVGTTKKIFSTVFNMVGENVYEFIGQPSTSNKQTILLTLFGVTGLYLVYRGLKESYSRVSEIYEGTKQFSYIEQAKKMSKFFGKTALGLGALVAGPAMLSAVWIRFREK